MCVESGRVAQWLERHSYKVEANSLRGFDSLHVYHFNHGVNYDSDVCMDDKRCGKSCYDGVYCYCCFCDLDQQ